MSRLRSINTSIWSDPWIEELDPREKLLFLYLITNEKTNMLGIYEASIKKIAFETGIDKSYVDKALKGFERVGKVRYEHNYIVLVNFMKHQNYNPNMKKNAIDIYNNLPKSLGINTVTISKDNPLEGFETLLKAMGMVRKVEVEYEEELEEEIEGEIEGEIEKPKNEIIFPFDSKQFKDQWQLWKDYKKKDHNFKFKSPQSEQASLNELNKLANGNEQIAIAIIHQSLANGWKGFFQLKNNSQNGITSKNNGRNYDTTQTPDELAEWLNRKHGANLPTSSGMA